MGFLHLCTSSSDARRGDWYWIFLPFFSFTTDRFIGIIFMEREDRRALTLKLLLWLVYVTLPSAAFPVHSNVRAHTLCRDLMDVLFPLAFLFNSIARYTSLTKRKRLC